MGFQLKIRKTLSGLLCLLTAVLLPGCAHYFELPTDSAKAAYEALDNPALQVDPPAFLVYGYQEDFNRIGRPAVRAAAGQAAAVYIDTRKPVLYSMQRSFSTSKGSYLNRIYRIHFPGVPFSLVPFNLTAGNNSGLMVVITYNQQQQPVLVTTVHTCGCYLSILPTNYLERDAFPDSWQDRPVDVYGETLPPLLDFGSAENPVLMVHLRPEVHRVMNLGVVDKKRLQNSSYLTITMSVAAMDTLERLDSARGPTNFYYEQGWRKGHVKGSWKPLETIFLSWLSLDLFVGSDKIYADPQIWDNRFYTSLKPWRRQESDMWDFVRFLTYWGWRL
jgi:hypothetical protein